MSSSKTGPAKDPSKPRIPPLEAPFSPSREAALARWMPKEAPVPPLALFRTLVRHEELAAALFEPGRYLLSKKEDKTTGLPARDREILIQRTTARAGCEYEWGVHAAFYGPRVGLSERELAATVSGDAAAFAPREAALVRLADELHDTARVSDVLYEELAAHWTPEQLLEAFAVVGFYHLIAFVANGARVPLEAFGARF